MKFCHIWSIHSVYFLFKEYKTYEINSPSPGPTLSGLDIGPYFKHTRAPTLTILSASVCPDSVDSRYIEPCDLV